MSSAAAEPLSPTPESTGADPTRLDPTSPDPTGVEPARLDPTSPVPTGADPTHPDPTRATADGAPAFPVLEHALLPVIPGRESEFEAAFAVARVLIERQDGVGHVQLSRGVESPSTYLLLAQWASVEAHQLGFRGSADYQEWKRLLHPFYEPFPVVEHFAPLAPATR